MNIVVTGSGGMLGRAVVKELKRRHITTVPLSHQALDIANKDEVAFKLGQVSEPVVINCAGLNRGMHVPDSTYMEVNALGPHYLADHSERVVQVSTPAVFSGNAGPYRESDTPDPHDIYGISKLAGEITWRREEGQHVTIRASFVGLESGFLKWFLDHPPGARVTGYTTWDWSGFYVRTFARGLVDIALNDSYVGLWHMPGGRISKYDLLEQVGRKLRPDIEVVPTKATPNNLALVSERQITTREPVCDAWDSMLDELAEDYRREWVF